MNPNIQAPYSRFAGKPVLGSRPANSGGASGLRRMVPDNSGAENGTGFTGGPGWPGAATSPARMVAAYATIAALTEPGLQPWVAGQMVNTRV